MSQPIRTMMPNHAAATSSPVTAWANRSSLCRSWSRQPAKLDAIDVDMLPALLVYRGGELAGAEGVNPGSGAGG